MWGEPTVYGNTDVSALEGGGVVDTVSSHAHHVAALLQDLHDGVLVLGEHLGKAVGMLHQLVHILDAFQVDDALLGLQPPAVVKSTRRPGARPEGAGLQSSCPARVWFHCGRQACLQLTGPSRRTPAAGGACSACMPRGLQDAHGR